MAKISLARELHFSTIDEICADAEQIAQCPDAPTRGNWSASENIWHVARYLQASVEGYPFQVPWYVKLIGPLMKKRLTSKTMSPGYAPPKQITREMEPQYMKPEVTCMANAIQLLTAWSAKADQQGFIPRNPAFGAMDRAQWVDLHCRHAELHFGLVELS